MTLALNLALGGLAMLAFLPLLVYLLYILAVEWSAVPSGIKATRLMMIVWSLTFMLQLGWKVYAGYHRAVDDGPVPYVEEFSLATTAALFVCAVMSLVAFGLRQRNSARHFRED